MNIEKKIVILTIVLLAILIVIGGVIAILNTKGRNELYGTVVSVITLDINPSIKLELDKDNKVINMIVLNEDAEDIVLSNYEGNSLEDVINEVTNKLIEKGYAQDKLVILVGTSGTITSDEVEDLYGTPDENGQSYVYEYHVSKTTGQITSKNKIRVLN